MKCRALLIVLALAGLAPAPAHADWIDVKGKGVMNGRILEETPESVRFRDNYGETHDVPRADVLLMEKTKESGASGGPFVPKRDKASAPDARATERDERPLAEGGSLEHAILSAVGRAAGYASRSLYGREDAVQAGEWASEGRRRVENYDRGNIALGAVGMLFILVGLLGSAGFSLLLMRRMFEEGIRWGLVYLSSMAIQFGEYFGGVGGLLLVVVPVSLNLYFVVRYWDVARKPVVGQLWSLNVALLGFLLLVQAS